jgi:heat shock protein HtpX
MLRISLFLLTNFAVMGVMYFTIWFFKLDNYMGLNINYNHLIIIAFVVGFSGSLISLLTSKWIAKRTMGIYIINPSAPNNEFQEWLINKVGVISHSAGIKTPEVGLYEGGANAFATGAFKNSALVAFSSELINTMTKEELEGVIAHEIGHVTNGDMVTMSLIQGVMNTFVFFISRVLANVAKKFLPESISNILYGILVFVLELVLGVLGSIVVMWFSRKREFRADKFSAEIVGKEKMINALIKLSNNSVSPLPQRMASMGISGNGLMKIFSTHPSLQSRVDYLSNL